MLLHELPLRNEVPEIARRYPGASQDAEHTDQGSRCHGGLRVRQLRWLSLHDCCWYCCCWLWLGNGWLVAGCLCPTRLSCLPRASEAAPALLSRTMNAQS